MLINVAMYLISLHELDPEPIFSFTYSYTLLLFNVNPHKLLIHVVFVCMLSLVMCLTDINISYSYIIHSLYTWFM